MDAAVEHSTTNDEGSMEHETTSPTMLDLANLVQDLKFEIATIVTESRALFKQQLLFTANNNPQSSPVM